MRSRRITFFVLLGVGGTFFGGVPAFAQYGSPGAPYTQTGSVDACNSSSVSLNSFAINQFYLYSASGVSVLYSGGVNTPGSGTINLQTAIPAGAVIVKAYLEVLQENGLSTAAVNFGSGTTGTGLEVGRGNFENIWTDPRYGTDLEDNENTFFDDVRYDVTSLVTAGVSSYTTNATGVLKGLVVVYTVNSPGTTGAVALGDGLFAWDAGFVGLDWGVTPFASTLDWSCQDNLGCGTNQFSRWGGVSDPDEPVSVTDEFFSDTNPAPAEPAAVTFGAGTIFQDSGTFNDTFLDTYQNVPLSSASGKITWALGNATSGEKQFYWVNLLAASCNKQVGPTSTPTFTPTSTNSFTPTNTGTSTYTATSTFSFTPTPTSTNSFTPTNSNTPTNSFTATNTATSTNSFTPTFSFTPSFTPTNTMTFTSSFTPTFTDTATNTGTPTFTATDTPTFTNSFTPTATFTSTSTPTATFSFTPTSTDTSTNSFTPTNTPTSTNTMTYSFTPTDTLTFTNSPTSTFTPTVTNTPTITFTSTASFTPTNTWTPTLTFTSTSTPTSTNTPTWTLTGTSTFTPTATSTWTSTGTPTFTGTATNTPVPMPYTVKVGIYNAAGELVKQVLTENSSQAIGSLSLPSGNAITSLTGQGSSISIYANGVPLATWDGSGASGNPVSNGSYFVRVDSIDSQGTDQSFSENVTVSRPLGKITAVICNAAGEVVRVLYTVTTGTTNDAVTSLQLSSSVLTVGPPSAQVILEMNNGLSVAWDGRGSNGQLVTNGVYFVQVYSTNGTGGEQVLTQQVTVINGGTRGGIVTACPNIWVPGDPPIVVKSSQTSLTLNVKLYDLAGERVGDFQGASGSSQAALDLDHLAAGVYIALTELWDGNGELVSRQTLKVAVRP